MYQYELGAALFAKRAADVAHWRIAILTGLRTFAQASEDVAQSPETLDILPEQSCREFLEFVHSTFLGKDELRVEENQTL